MKAITITNGSIKAVDAPGVREALATLGSVTKRRASHVVPVNPVKRVAFQALRAMFPDTSKVAGWTRGWKGPWVADLAPSNGPILGAFDSRTDAIAAEVRWLNQSFMLGGKK